MSNWPRLPLKRLAAVDNSGVWGSDPDQCDNPIPVSTTAHISPDGLFDVPAMPQRCLTPDEQRRYVCQPGDVIVVKASGSADNVVSGKCGLVTGHEGCFAFGNFLMRLKPRRTVIRPEFLHLVVTSADMRKAIELMVLTTTYPNLQLDEYLNFRVPLPSLPEQDELLSALSVSNRKISQFIEDKRCLIELFEEQKRAMISRAVTRGVNLDALMKASGLDWLGPIPSHWRVLRNGRLFRERIQSGYDGLPVLTVSLNTGVSIGQEVDDEGRPRRLIEDRSTYKFAAAGDIAYNTMRMWQGATGVVPADGLVSPAYVVAEPMGEVNPMYYSYLFRTQIYKAEVNRNSRGIVSDRNRLYWDDFKQLPSPVPPFDEQETISQAIDADAAKIDRAIRTAEREIELIQEFRTTLISDAVTGKLDVRKLLRKEHPL